MNATKFMANSSAELTCAFPSPQSILMWYNKKLGYNMMCKNETSCDSVAGYILSRHEQNITLIIKNVVPDMNSWQCSNLRVTLSEFMTFTVIGECFALRFFLTITLNEPLMKLLIY